MLKVKNASEKRLNLLKTLLKTAVTFSLEPVTESCFSDVSFPKILNYNERNF